MYVLMILKKLENINNTFKAKYLFFVAVSSPEGQCHIVMLRFWLVKESYSSKSIYVLWYPEVLKAEI